MKLYLSNLILESSVRYSTLSDALSEDTIDRSQFASCVAGQRLEIVKALRAADHIDVELDLDEAQEEVWNKYKCTGWQSCIDLDSVILDTLSASKKIRSDSMLQFQIEQIWRGINTDLAQSMAYAENPNPRSDFWRCTNCGCIVERVGEGCGLCGASGNWFVPFTPLGASDEAPEDVQAPVAQNAPPVAPPAPAGKEDILAAVGITLTLEPAAGSPDEGEAPEVKDIDIDRLPAPVSDDSPPPDDMSDFEFPEFPEPPDK